MGYTAKNDTLEYLDAQGRGQEADVVVAVAPGGGPVGSGAGGSSGGPVTVTRPADTTPYGVGDVVGAALAAITLPLAGLAGGSALITGASLEMDVAAVPSGQTSFRLHLYSATPPSALADNAVWDLPAGDRATYLGYIDLGTPVDVGSSLFVQNDDVRKTVRMGAGTSLFGYLVTASAYTPASGAVHRVAIQTVVI